MVAMLLKIARWGGLVPLLVIPLLVVYSTERTFGYDSYHRSFSIQYGCIEYWWWRGGVHIEDVSKYSVVYGWHEGGLGWPGPPTWSFAFLQNRFADGIRIPLWAPWLLCVFVTALAWWLDRRRVRERLAGWFRWLRPDRRAAVNGRNAGLFFLLYVFGLGIPSFGLVTLGNRFQISLFQRMGEWLLQAIVLAIPAAIALAWLWTRFLNRLRTRYPTTGCKHCGYDLFGNESGICPECGMVVEDAEAIPATDPID